MVTLYTYSDPVVISIKGTSYVNSSFVTLLDGRYGLLIVDRTTDPLSGHTTLISEAFRPFDVISGLPMSDIPLQTVGSASSYELGAWQLANGDFVQIGGGYDDDLGQYKVDIQLLKAGGTPRSAEFTLGANTQYCNVTALAQGGFIATWNQYDSANRENGWDAATQIFDTKGHAVGGPILIGGAGNQGAPALALLQGGGFVESWIDRNAGWALRAQVFDAAGNATTAVVTIDSIADNYSSDNTIAALSNGSFVVTWSTDILNFDLSTSTTTDYARIYGANGQPLGAAFTVDALTTSGDAYDSISAASVTALADGRFAMTWTARVTAPPDTSSWQYYTYSLFQIFDANGKPASIIYSLGANDGHASGLHLQALPDGRIAALWSQQDAVTTQSETVTQILDPRDHAIDLTGNALADQYVGTIYDDTIRGLAGGDALFGADGNDLLNGGTGADILLGGVGSDTLLGSDGNDYLSGFNGNDHLNGGKGNDLELSGFGHDVFVFAPGDGSDKITGFDNGSDMIDLADYHLTNFAGALRHFSTVATGVEFALGSDMILIAGLTLDQVTSDDLILR